MKNEVFKNVTQTVEVFQADYQAKLQAAEDHLQQETKKKAEAEAKAAAAVAADDRATWKKADKDRTDAAAGIKYAQERLAMIQKQCDFPLADFDRLRIRSRPNRAGQLWPLSKTSRSCTPAPWYSWKSCRPFTLRPVLQRPNCTQPEEVRTRGMLAFLKTSRQTGLIS